MNKDYYSIVIPVYRSSRTLEELCNRLQKVFEESIQSDFEIILVDDSSPDNSWEIMQSLNKGDERIKIVQLARNFGQHNAIMCGFHIAQGNYVVTMDDDLQHPPEEIPVLIKALDEHPEADVVIGEYISKQHSFIRNLGTKTMNRITSMINGKDPNLKLTSFRLMRAQVVKDMTKISVEKPRIGYLLLKVTNKIINVPVQHDARAYGKSGYTFLRLAKDFFNNIINHSSFPLKLISYIGFLSSVVSFILAFYYLYRYFFIGISVPGWTTLILLVLFYFGILLFSVGLIGEYLIKILTETKRFPQYLIRKKKI